jgi:lysyl-tRNA synthetase class 2
MGDPIGPKEDWGKAVDALEREVGSVAYVAVGEEFANFLAERGGKKIYLGSEAVVHFDQFPMELKGGKYKQLRQGVNRVANTHELEIRRVRQLTPADRAAMQAISDEWVKANGQSERGASMSLGRLFDSRDDDDAVVVFARERSEGKRITGFIQFLPWGGDGLTLDVMRRLGDANSALFDFLIVEGIRNLSKPAFAQEKELSPRAFGQMSLNFAMWRDLLISKDHKLTRWSLLQASKVFPLDSLRKYNEKFEPEWVRRYALVKGAASVPMAALRYARVEGYLDPHALQRRGDAKKS